MSKPDAKAIRREIADLKEIKPTLHRRSSFGDDHHAAVEAQIYVLEHNSTNDEIYDKFEAGAGWMARASQPIW